MALEWYWEEGKVRFCRKRGGPKKASRAFARTLRAPEVTCFGREAYREPEGWRDLGVSQLFRSGEFTGRGEKA